MTLHYAAKRGTGSYVVTYHTGWVLGSVRRFQSGMRGSGVQWVATDNNGKRVCCKLSYGGYYRTRAEAGAALSALARESSNPDVRREAQKEVDK